MEEAEKQGIELPNKINKDKLLTLLMENKTKN